MSRYENDLRLQSRRRGRKNLRPSRWRFVIILPCLPCCVLSCVINSSLLCVSVTCDLKAPHRLTLPAFEAHLGATTFPPEGSANAVARLFSTAPSAFPQTPFHCPRSRKATLERDRPVTQSIATRSQEKNPGPHLWIETSLAKAWSVSPHLGADGLVQGELPPISPEC